MFEAPEGRGGPRPFFSCLLMLHLLLLGAPCAWTFDRVAFAPPTCRRAVGVRACAEPAPAMETYDDAEKRGMELFQAGEHERAIRMFELAQTLPGEGVDFKRVKQGGMIGSATAPANPIPPGEVTPNFTWSECHNLIPTDAAGIPVRQPTSWPVVQVQV